MSNIACLDDTDLAIYDDVLLLASPVVAPWLSRTSASLSLLMICSGVNAFFAIYDPPFSVLTLTLKLDQFSGGRSEVQIQTINRRRDYNRGLRELANAA